MRELREVMLPILTNSLYDHVDRDSQVDQLDGLMECSRNGRDGREVDVGCQRTVKPKIMS